MHSPSSSKFSSPRTPRKNNLAASKELPDLSKEDTKCEYCGVSYLIHSKVKSLEEKVKTLREQLQRYETVSNIEEHLNLEYQIKIDAINSDHQKEIDDMMERYSTKMKEQQIQHNNSVALLQTEIEKKKKAGKKMAMELKMVLARVMAYRMQFNLFKTEVSQKVKQTSEALMEIGPPIYKRAYALQINAVEQTNTAQKSLEEANRIKDDLTKEVMESTSSNKSLSSQLRKATDTVSGKDKDIEELNKKVEELTANTQHQEEELEKLRKQIEVADENSKKSSTDIEIATKKNRERESEITTLKSKIANLNSALEENKKTIVAKEQDISSRTENVASLEKQIAELTLEKNETISQYQYQMSQVEETTKAKIASMKSSFQEQIKELQQKESGAKGAVSAKDAEFENKLSKAKQDYQTSLDSIRSKNEKLTKEIESIKDENRNLQMALHDEKNKAPAVVEKIVEKIIEKEIPVEVQVEKDYLPLEVMENQLLKLGDIVAKKEKEITHLQFIIQQECNERAELKHEISELRQRLKDQKKK